MSSFYDWIFNRELDLNKKVLSTQSVDYTNQDILNDVDKYASLLESLGDIKGRKVALIVPKVHTFLTLVLAINKLGGIVIPLSIMLRKTDLFNVLDFASPHIVFTVAQHNGFAFGEHVQKWALSCSKETIIYESEDHTNWKMNAIPGQSRPLEQENIAIIGCTSGSTGVPKGLIVDLDFVKFQNKAFGINVDISIQDKVCLMSPASGVFGLMWLLSGLRTQYHMAAAESFSFPDMIGLLEENLCSKLVTTPSLFKALYLLEKNKDTSVLDSLELISLHGENITLDFITFVSAVRCKINSGYGFSELGAMMYTKDDIRKDIKWSLVPDVQFKLDNQTDDGIGELLFTNPNGFLGYYLRPDLTKEVYRDGWFHSGDLARLTGDGNIVLVGRKKEMIKKGGQQVIPGEIEQILGKHPSVQKASVVGIPHPIFGEQIIAFVTGDQSIETEELYSYCQNSIARYKVPDRIFVIDELPINQGKTDKVTLRQLAIEKNL